MGKYISGIAVAVEDANGWRREGAWPSIAYILANA